MNRLIPFCCLLLVMAVVVVACDSGQNTTSTTSTTETQETTQSTETTTPTESPTDTSSSTETSTTNTVSQTQDEETPSNIKILGAEYGLTETGTAGGKVVIAAVSGPKTLNNLIAQETSTTNITRLMHKGLVEVNPLTFEVEPALASDWEYSSDNKTVTFNLRHDIKFSDGRPFTADDVVFTYNDLVFNDDISNDTRDSLLVKGEPIRVEKIDDYTVTITSVEPFRPLLRALASNGAEIYPKHLIADKVAKLNPGVRGVIRFVKQTLDANVESLEALSADLTQSLGTALNATDGAIGTQNGSQINALAGSLRTALEGLIALTGEDQANLKADLEKAITQIDKLGDNITAGQWEGIPPGTFMNAWSVETPASEFAGLGPFEFVRYDVDQQVILKRNPHYWKTDANGVQLPYVDQLVVLIVENLDVSFLKFKTGETDTFAARPEDWPLLLEGVPEEDCQQTEAKIICLNKANGWELLRDGPLFGTTFITINQDAENPVLREVFRNKQFHKAVAYALDKPSMIDNIYNGLAIPQWSPVSIPSPYFDDSRSFETYPLDIEKSQQMLEDLGLIDTDGDDTRNITDQFLEAQGFNLSTLSGDAVNQDNRELEYAFTTNSGNTLRERISSLIVSDLAKVGIRLDYRPLDFNALVTDLTGGKYESVLIGFTGGVEPNNQSNIWTTPGGLHFWRYSAKTDPPEWEKRVDELYELAAITMDEEKVKEYYKEFQYLVSDNLPLIYTINQQFTYASKADLGNNDHFQPITGNVPPVLAFSEILWWQDEARRSQIEDVEPQ